MNVIELIEHLRKKNNIYIEEFVSGICSSRQYRRYIRGEQSISNTVMIAFLDQLGLDFIEFIRLKEEKEDSIRVTLFNLLDLLNEYRYKEVKDKLLTIDSDSLETKVDSDLHNFLTLISNYHLNLDSEAHTKHMLSKLIEYPHCLKKEMLSHVEQNSLLYLIKFSDDSEEKLSILHKLKNISMLSNNGFTKDLITNVNLIQQLSVLEKHNDVINYINEIEEKIRDSIELKALVNLFYFKIVAQEKLNINDSNARSIFRTLCYLENNKDRVIAFQKDFKRLLKTDLELN